MPGDIDVGHTLLPGGEIDFVLLTILRSRVDVDLLVTPLPAGPRRRITSARAHILMEQVCFSHFKIKFFLIQFESFSFRANTEESL